ncbi:PspC domain-containing protein [Sediminicola arcticus]|jgi:phage shock protein PspC (stress-responsive transcriptional regulator)|uniref:PspC domain-containing protein n=1 Tax=Sediminicola arcticus TaxID=1574308 RepID=A0ABV2SZL0_9FLAO
MNKTVNINLANILFHIDEEAYLKMSRYLEAIKRSFANTSGNDEIIRDIEARIAELFQEKIENERQVITLKEVDEVINIMGQPEDYMVDEDIFEDTPNTSASKTAKVKKLYRDTDSKFIGGVCSGLEYYMGIDALWIRIIFILLALSTGFGFIAYVLLWILVPEASTTSQKLDMRGEPVNISNIERKVKEGFDDVASKVKNVDYEKMGDKVKSSGKSFADALGDIIMFFFKIVGKFIGILLILIGATSLIGIFIGMFTVGVLDMFHIPGVDFYDMVNSTDAPVWLVSVLGLFAFGIPFFFLLYLGLKILVTNLKSIGNIIKFSLLGLWLLSVIGLTILGIQQASAHAYNGSTAVKEELYFENNLDTLMIGMNSSDLYNQVENGGFDGMSVAYNEKGDRLLYTEDIRFDIKKSEDSLVYIRIRKDADGSSFENARKRADRINYRYTVKENSLFLDNFLTTSSENKVRDQKVYVTIYVPINKSVSLNNNTKYHVGWGTENDKEVYRSDMFNYTWKMNSNGILQCLNCPDDMDDEMNKNQSGHIIIDENGVDIDIKDKNDKIRVKINEKGVQIKSDDN